MSHPNQQDLDKIKSIATAIKDMTIMFDLSYSQSAVEELLADIDMSMRAILEIINGSNGKNK